MESERLPRRRIVLLGIGHTNAHIVRKWGMSAIPDTELVCLSDYGVATYSGMLPAVLAGQKTPEEMQIDLVRLCSSVGAKLITDPVVDVDAVNQRVVFESRPALHFDALSIGVGSRPTPAADGELAASVVCIKPMQTLLDRLERHLANLKSRDAQAAPLRVAVVGAGVAGIEIACCIVPFLKSHGWQEYDLHLLTRSPQILPQLSPKVRELASKRLTELGYEAHVGCQIESTVEHNNEHGPPTVELAGSQQAPFDLVLWATGATASGFLRSLNLPQDERGFLLTESTLQTTAGQPIFAVGDSGTIEGADLPKAGVYAVRQGPVLWNNLERLLTGQRLEAYRPQRSFLKLINTGNNSAIAQWNGLTFANRWAYRLKDRIDSKFMQLYEPKLMDEDDSDPMQCRGCGCKLGSQPLARSLQSVSAGQTVAWEDVAAIGGSNPKDQLVASVDFFASPFADAYLAGRVAAIHAVSDLVAAGAELTEALAVTVVPEGPTARQEQTLAEITAGAQREFQLLGGSIVGGHTIVGPRLEIGFTVVGRVAPNAMSKGGLRAGDELYVSKPLGIGILLAAHMRSRCSAGDYEHLLKVMLNSQHDLASLLVASGVQGCTDVTGFGLLGHLAEMIDASSSSADVPAKLTAELAADSIPVLPGVQAALDAGIESSLAPSNRSIEGRIRVSSSGLTPLYPVLFDPQTCGGLLFGVAPEQSEALMARIASAGIPAPAQIGRVIDRPQDAPAIILK